MSANKTDIYSLAESCYRQIGYVFRNEGKTALSKFIFPQAFFMDDAFVNHDKFIKRLLDDKANILKIFSASLRLLSLYIYSKYRKWALNHPIDPQSPPAFNSDERVFAILRKLYHQYDFTFDAVNFIIINTQIALGKGGSIMNSKVGIDMDLSVSATGNGVTGQVLMDCLDSAALYDKLAKVSNREFYALDSMLLLQNLYSLLKAMEFFGKIQLIINPDSTVDIIDDDTLIPTGGALRYFPENETNPVGEILYLNKITQGDNRLNLIYEHAHTLEQHMLSFCTHADQPDTIHTHSIENEYIKLTSNLLHNRTTTTLFSGLLSSNYKYISKLARSVCDAIGDAGEAYKRKLIKLAVDLEEYEELGEFAEECAAFKNDENCFDNIAWDNTLTKLFTYESPTNVLTALFDGADNNYLLDKIMAYLKIRLWSSFDIEKTKKRRDELVENMEADIRIFNIGRVFAKTAYIEKWKNKILAECSINALISALTAAEEEHPPAASTYVFSYNIHDKIAFLRSLRAGRNCSFEDAVYTCNRLMRHTITVMLCFYEGIYAATENTLIYETETSSRMLSPKRLDEYKHKILESFMTGAKNKADELNGINTLSALLHELKAMCEDSHATDGINTLSRRGTAYKIMLGRQMLDFSKLCEIVSFNDETVSLCALTNAGKTEYVDDIDKVDETNYDAYLFCCQKLLEFLAAKHIDETERVVSTAYPFVATYCGTNINRDRNQINIFSLLLDDKTLAEINSSHKNINISTEFSYQINDKYFCLPNIDRINGKLWIDPLLIGCHEFNETIMGIKKQEDRNNE